MNPISATILTFANNLKIGEYYKAPLPIAEQQGHIMIAMVLEKAAAHGELMASIASDILTQLVSLQTKIAVEKAVVNADKQAVENVENNTPDENPSNE